MEVHANHFLAEKKKATPSSQTVGNRGFVGHVSWLLTNQRHAGVGRSQLVGGHAGVVAIAILGDVTHCEDGPGAHVLDVDACLTLAESENTRKCKRRVRTRQRGRTAMRSEGGY